jgi:hypothetical protein
MMQNGNKTTQPASVKEQSSRMQVPDQWARSGKSPHQRPERFYVEIKRTPKHRSTTRIES